MASTEVTSAQPKIKVYWLNKSRSQRILWLLEELHLDYDVEVFHRNPETKMAPPELREIHPLGKSPVVSITSAGSTQPIVLAESGFIVEYLLDHFAGTSTLSPQRYPDGREGKVGQETEEWMRYRYFLHYAEGTLMTYLLLTVVSQGIKNAPVPFFIKPIAGRVADGLQSSFIDPNLKSNFRFLDDQVKTSPEDGKYLCGPRLTGADILMSFPLMAAKVRGLLKVDEYPSLYAYVARLEEEPAYQRAVERIVKLEGSYEVVAS